MNHIPSLILKLLGFAIVLVLQLAACSPNSHYQNDRPNILFIMGDDHTSQAWRIYGSVLDSVVHTPNISRLRDEGAQLMNTFATNSICVPSRASILTGQYSHRNQVYTLADTLNPNRETVSTLLRANGYQTALIGKWHLKSKPVGFDYFNILPRQGRYHNPVLKDMSNWQKNGGGREYQGFSTDIITDLSLDWLRQRDQNNPFMLMVHFKAVHEPFDYADRFDTLYQHMEIPGPESLYDFYPEKAERTFEGQVLEILGQRYEQRPGRYPGPPLSLQDLSKQEARKKIYQKFIKDYLRSVAGIDENIGRLLDFLDRQNLSENTVVVYTSDQGYFLGEHGLFDKRIMYEESLRMPFVIRYPKEIEAGSKNSDIILNIDFAPLMLDYAGISIPKYMQGQSFRENLADQTPDGWRQSMYYRYWMHQQHRPAHFGIRTQRYKLIFFYGQPLMNVYGEQSTDPTWEFYDLQKDSRERHNRYHDPQYQPVIERLRSDLFRIKENLGDSDREFPIMQQIINNISL